MSRRHTGRASPPLPVFIFGLTQRSGTNLLYRALLEHPDCVAAKQPGEDFLFHEADLLTEYASRVERHWNPKWNVGGVRTRDLERGLGAGLLSHLHPDLPCSAFVSKTPSVRNIGLVSRFLPDARMLVVVRDGRDVVESGVLGFGWTYTEGFRRWSRAAEELLRFLEADADAAVLIRFEELVQRPREEIGRALRACGLAFEQYPYERLGELPVYGSSTLPDGRGRVHWNPLSKPTGFNPVGRWKDWDERLELRYDRSCGALAERLGYARQPEATRRGSSAVERIRLLLDRR